MSNPPAEPAETTATEARERPGSWLRASPWRLPFLLLLVLSALTRLAALGHPHSVVFDEVHFGKYATHYCCDHERFFDIHPPAGKLVIAGTARLLGYRGGFSFDHDGQPFGDISPWPLRLAPALAGMSLPLIVFVLLRLLGATPAASLFGGLLLTFDNALTAHSRMIGVDGIMLAGMFGGLACWLAASRAQRPVGRYGWALASGLLLGLGIATKLIGLAMLGLVGLCVLVEILREFSLANLARRVGQGLLIVGAALAVYLLSFALHFALLTEPGPGDIWQLFPTGHLLSDTIALQRLMIDANHSVGTNPFSSPWWSWPLMAKPIYYWVGPQGIAKIYLLGNPLVWWGGSLLFVAMLVFLVLRKVTSLRIERGDGRAAPALWLPITGFVMCYLPFALITRVMFMYHFLAALLFMLLAVVLWLDHAGWTRPGGWRAQRASYYAVIGVLVLCFVLLAPLTYGLQLGAGLDDHVFMLFPR